MQQEKSRVVDLVSGVPNARADEEYICLYAVLPLARTKVSRTTRIL